MGEAAGDYYARNAKWAKHQAGYQTALDPAREMQFREWVAKNKIPFDPADPDSDYDMRGYWADGQAGGTQVNANDGRPHYPDTYKTPYHRSFSRESRYALPSAPYWANDDQLVDADGNVIFDERAGNR
jgi:hypothetical protein